MRQVRIAELKARLSEYVRAVRAGESVVVLDRETPVARLVPVRGDAKLPVRRTPGAPPPNRVALPKLIKIDVDVVKVLLEERRGAE